MSASIAIVYATPRLCRNEITHDFDSCNSNKFFSVLSTIASLRLYFQKTEPDAQ
jgi:hypothetical protein